MRKRHGIFIFILLIIVILFLINNYILKPANNSEILKQSSGIYQGNDNSKGRKKIEEIRIPILMYHHISEDPLEWNSSIISPDKFREDMLYLKALGYNTIHFKDYIDFIENGKELIDNPILITFDDGYLSNYQYAYPILKELDMKATISIVGWSVGRKYHKDGSTPIYEHFTWEQAKEMYNSGTIDIQHHTYDLHNEGDVLHYGKGVSRKENENEEDYIKRFTNDTVKLKKLIEQNIGNEAILYVYPYGMYNETTEKIIKELGFKVSVTTKMGITPISDELYLLNRINMPSDVSSPELMKKILEYQGIEKQIPFIDIDDNIERIAKLKSLLKERNNK